MKGREKKGAAVGTGSGIVVGSGKRRVLHLEPQVRVVAILVVAALVVGVAGTVLYIHHKDNETAHQAMVNRQKQLVKRLNDANSLGDLTKLKSDSSALIQGAANGTYKVPSKDLAQAYANRGTTELNAGNYKAAIADFQMAEKLDSSQTDLVGYSEFIARYHLGERKTLIPLLQTLAKSLKNNFEPQMQSTLAQYNEYIADLQAGQDLPI
ncbi:MAG TPA: tetratricopeptide repeat protein [Candidatus Saccharimonadia bacterium]|nr:tetratricopeptide repeat protein [Candidatus Saccharimonadia bacterium]